MITSPVRKSRRNAGNRGGRRESGSLLTMRIWQDERPKLYFSTPRRLGTAVQRNHLRRQLRQVSRRRPEPGFSMVIEAAALPASFQNLEDEYLELLSRLGVSSE